MSDAPDAGIPPAEVARRLEELRALYKFGLALTRVRFVDEPDQVREGPPPPPDDAQDGPVPPRRDG
ncbi:MAG: hypothetical protein NTY35_11175 [Planctomycetota bacterium]|nr:hypothetical protein [Planctomycetota bacterium]